MFNVYDDNNNDEFVEKKTIFSIIYHFYQKWTFVLVNIYEIFLCIDELSINNVVMREREISLMAMVYS